MSIRDVWVLIVSVLLKCVFEEGALALSLVFDGRNPISRDSYLRNQKS